MKSPHQMGVLCLALAAVGAGLAGCAARDSAGGTITGSGGSGGCTTSACVPAVTTHTTWAIEIDPLSSSPAALTELVDVDVAVQPLTLTASSQAAVSASFAGGPNSASGAVPATANVVLTVPPLIPGRPDLTFEASAAFDMASGATSGSLELPAQTMDRMGTLQLIPLAPSDQQRPPASFDVTVAATFAETLPASYFAITGSLISAINQPISTFVARAFAAGTQISNAPLTAADGTFQLLLPLTAAGTPVIIELTPKNQGGGDPWYTSSPFTPVANKPLDPIMLPAYSSPNVFRLKVVGADDPSFTVSGTFVRAQGILASSAAGATDFQRDGTTASDGTVTLSLLPGTANTVLDYDLTVIPPASSAYATRCISPVGVTVGGTATAPVSLLTVGLLRRSVLAGLVTDAAGRPVSKAAITATAGPDPTASCPSTPAVSSSLIAGDDGSFQLLLDPGTYQLDYDPPVGSAAPRFTEAAVVVPSGAGQIAHDVTLPVGAMVQGTVYGPDHLPLQSATVRIFEVRCTGQDGCFGPMRVAPGLLAQTVSDTNGTFRAVVPAPQPTN